MQSQEIVVASKLTSCWDDRGSFRGSFRELAPIVQMSCQDDGREFWEVEAWFDKWKDPPLLVWMPGFKSSNKWCDHSSEH